MCIRDRNNISPPLPKTENTLEHIRFLRKTSAIHSTLLKPDILIENVYSSEDLEAYKKAKQIWKTHDMLSSQLQEWVEITHAEDRQSPFYLTNMKKFLTEYLLPDSSLKGNWIYYPWNGYLLHTVTEEQYQTIRFNRNRNLITEQEQKRLRDAVIGIAGLSVGSNIAFALAYMGIGKQFKCADCDVLETSNLNRVRFELKDMGLSKVEATCQRLWELDPYLDCIPFIYGLTPDSLDDFVLKSPVPSVIFDEMDDFFMKIQLRFSAKKARIPIMMFTNLGDRVLIDIERYDENPDLPILNGVLGDLPEKIRLDSFSFPQDARDMAIKFVGHLNIPERALESLELMKTSLLGRPQLSTTVGISGEMAAYFTRKLILGETLPSGRRLISFSDIFE